MEGLGMEKYVIFYGRLVYFVAIWYILWPFGIFCGHLVYFLAIWYIFWPLVVKYCGQLGSIFYGHLA
jgi:hypothetical protein